MKFREDRPSAGVDAAVKKLLEIANEPGGPGFEAQGSAVPRRAVAELDQGEEPKSSGDAKGQGSVLVKGYCAQSSRGLAFAKVLNRVMTEKFAPPSVTIRRYWASTICDVVVVVRDQEMVIRCPSYSQAVKWARLECKSYKIPEPDIDFPDDNQETDDVPLFLRSDKN